jgi:O-antigen/teichoic acid export membrane protein
MSDGEVKKIASGGGIVLVASLIDRAVRFAVTWLLSTSLGAGDFGVYTHAVTIVTVITVLSPLGLNSGAVYFGAQYAKTKEEGKRKGLVFFGSITTLISGMVSALGLWFLAPILFDDPTPYQWIAPTIAIWTPLMFCVGLLTSIKDMLGSALVYQIILPLSLFIGAGIIYVAQLDIKMALIFYWLALGIAFVISLFWVWRRFKKLIQDGEIEPEYERTKILQYSIPQGLAGMVFRLTVWMDILMMGYYSTDEQLGIYRIASALAMIGGIPITALTSIFNPIIAELVAVENFTKLNSLLKTVTRWLLLLSLPILIFCLALPDVLLRIFDPVYSASRIPLIILLCGQFFWVFCAMSMRLIPMSGRSMLTLINGIVAVVLNIICNIIFIPQYGAIGAAIATIITLNLWAGWRLFEIWHIMRCHPFSKGNILFFIVCVGISVLLYQFSYSWEIWLRISLAIAGCLSITGIGFWLGKTKDDDIVIEALSKKLRRFKRK